MKYKDLNGIESLISDLILQLLILSYMAEDERLRIRESQKEGIKAAIDKGTNLVGKKLKLLKVLNQFILIGSKIK